MARGKGGKAVPAGDAGSSGAARPGGRGRPARPVPRGPGPKARHEAPAGTGATTGYEAELWAMAERHTAEGQRQLRLGAAHRPPSRARRGRGLRAHQRLEDDAAGGGAAGTAGRGRTAGRGHRREPGGVGVRSRCGGKEAVLTVLHPQWRSRLQIPCAGKTAEIAVDQIRTISKQRLRRRLDRLSSEHAAQLRRIITEMYGE